MHKNQQTRRSWGACQAEVVPEPIETDEVTAANAEFYAAFESRELDRTADGWDRSDRATVTRAGWPTLPGCARVAASWEAIFANTPYIQFVLTDESVTIVGDAA